MFLLDCKYQVCFRIAGFAEIADRELRATDPVPDGTSTIRCATVATSSATRASVVPYAGKLTGTLQRKTKCFCVAPVKGFNCDACSII